MKPPIFENVTSRILFVVVTCASISLSRADDLPELNKECFQQKKGRSCVRLGTTLWQTPARRTDARAAFAKGCELKIESACTLKDMPQTATGDGAVGIGTAKPELRSAAAINGIEKLAPSKFKISRAVAEKYAGDLDKTLSSAKMEASVFKGATQGYRFKSIEKDSVFEAMGFLPDDVITKVNDQKITTPADAMSLLPALLTGATDTYAVHMIRGGQTLTHKYQIVE